MFRLQDSAAACAALAIAAVKMAMPPREPGAHLTRDDDGYLAWNPGGEELEQRYNFRVVIRTELVKPGVYRDHDHICIEEVLHVVGDVISRVRPAEEVNYARLGRVELRPPHVFDSTGIRVECDDVSAALMCTDGHTYPEMGKPHKSDPHAGGTALKIREIS